MTTMPSSQHPHRPHHHRSTSRVRLFTPLVAAPILAASAEAQETYRRPPAEIVRILEAPPTPAVSVDPTRTLMLLIERENMPPISELAKPMLRLAGDRINPNTNGPFTTSRNTGLTLKRIADGAESKVELAGAEGANIGFPNWSPDGTRFAFTVTRDYGIELWVAELAFQDDAVTAKARALTGAVLNAAFATPFDWLPDGEHIVCRLVPDNRGPAPQADPTPVGPIVQQCDGSAAAPVRTYQDLLESPHDEALFDHYMTQQLAIISVNTGERTNWLAPAIYDRVDFSPSGAYALVSRVVRPYSYLVPSGLFPQIVELRDRDGALVREIARIPLLDTIPIEGVQTGPRSFMWRANSDRDELFWIEALDGGNPKNKVPHRDRMMRLVAPFTPSAEPEEVLQTEHRFAGIHWLQTPSLMMVTEYDRDRRWRRTWLHDLSNLGDPAVPAKLVWDRSVHDRYGDPGRPFAITTPAGRSVTLVRDNCIYLTGNGATRQGDRPFLDRMNLQTLETERLWQCGDGSLEYVAAVLSDDASEILTVYQTPTVPPNYFVRAIGREGRDRQLTQFPDPAPELQGIRKELVTYQREDGVTLSATLYLPPDYREGERLPLIIWAYPREFTDASTAGQVSGSPYHFTRIEGASHLFLLLQGYAIMDGATMPVIGDPETMNDTFIQQIVASAKAAIDKAVELGVADRNRVGGGGHSYGAFMTANLMAHCDLFKAGVARSGAYNRTLTPFGFQSERRTFWEAPKSYFELSPFTYAHKIKQPLLLIHGELDNNSGTFPMQSERLYHAIKGNGGTARLVMLPYESHGYRAKESIMHTLAEMIDWFDEHVKYADVPLSEPEEATAPGN